MVPTTMVCWRCQQEKPDSEFAQKRSVCDECKPEHKRARTREGLARWREKNPDAYRKWWEARKRQDPEFLAAHRQRQRERYHANPEANLVAQREYRARRKARDPEGSRRASRKHSL